MKRVTILTSGWALALLAAHAAVACSSSDDSEQDVAPLTGAGGAAAAPAMAAPVAAAAGTANVATPASPAPVAAGGSEGMPPIAPPAPAAAAGTGNAASGAMAGAAGASMGAAGAPPTAPTAGDQCPDVGPSPSDGVPCSATCTDLCGVQNLGSRVCTCTDGAFDCATCEFTVEHPLLAPPTEPLVNCDASDDVQENDESGCTDNERCQSIGRTPGAADGANRFCGCLGGSWDCDTKPASFGG